MKKYLPYILILIALVGIFSPMTITHADNTSYQLLTPLPDTNGGTITTVDTSGDTNSLGKYLNPMIMVFIGICAVLAVVMIVMGGIQVMTSEISHTKQAGKERIWNALLGLLIALGAYALLFTINPDLLNTDLKSATKATPPAAPTQTAPLPTISIPYSGSNINNIVNP